VITHNASIAAMADRVLRMTSGHIGDVERHARRATPEEISW
jgi:putative ABC transport system ATP-binding protein